MPVSPLTTFPLPHYDRLCFLKNVVDHPQIEIGDYTYYDDFATVENFETFIMNGANHLTDAVSTYPFAIFGEEWSGAMDGKTYPARGNTVIGNDVWIGFGATIMVRNQPATGTAVVGLAGGANHG